MTALDFVECVQNCVCRARGNSPEYRISNPISTRWCFALARTCMLIVFDTTLKVTIELVCYNLVTM